MLAAIEVPVVALRDEFSTDIQDPDLLRNLKGTDYVFVSSDQRMRRNPIEASLLKQAGVTAIFFGPFWGKMTFWSQAKWLVTRWERIHGFVDGARKGTCAEVQQSGRSRVIPL